MNVDGFPLCIKNGPHRVTKLAPGNRIPIDLDNKSSAPDTAAETPKTSAYHPSLVDIATALLLTAIQLGLISSSIGGRRRKEQG
ncbi:hypothetical protein V8C35DRAFT_305514 [Trichoderma chlorosporum]